MAPILDSPLRLKYHINRRKRFFNEKVIAKGDREYSVFKYTWGGG